MAMSVYRRVLKTDVESPSSVESFGAFNDFFEAQAEEV